MASKYDFRILIDTIDGENLSYGTQSFVEVQPNTSLVVNTDEMVDKINNMPKVQFYNGKTYATASSLFLVKGSTQFSGSTGVSGGPSDYQFVSASIKGNRDSGSIVFHANNVANNNGDFIKRYKFFGNKVCNVLGVPENYWIYADKFRFTNTGSEQNYISGDVLAQSLHLRDNFAISNAGAIESDLPMKHAKDTDRWLKWTDVSSSIPQNDMLIGYSNQSDDYMIRMQNNKNLIISSSTITASNDIFLPKGNLIGNLNSTKLSNINQLEVDSIIGTNDDTNTGISFSGNDIITFQAGGVTAFQITKLSSVPRTTIALGNSSNDVDVRIDAGTANSFFITSSNQNVGIGTTSPSEKLHIDGGNVRLESTYGYYGSFLQAISSTGLKLGNDDFSGYMFFNDNGNIGIGTESPSKKLQVTGDISASGDLFVNDRLDVKNNLAVGNTIAYTTKPTRGAVTIATASNALTNASNPTNYHLHLRDYENATGNGIGIAFGMSSNETSLGASIIHKREGSNSAGRLEFHTNGADTGAGLVTPRVIIDNTGNMIVSQSLEVQENFTVAGTFNPSTISTTILTASTAALIGDNNSVNTFPADGEPILQLRRGAGGNNHFNFFASDTGCFIISDDVATNQKDFVIAASPTGDNNTDRDIVFQTGKSSGNFLERMRIEGNGNVGIGIAVPKAKLHVQGDISQSSGHLYRGPDFPCFHANLSADITNLGTSNQYHTVVLDNDSGTHAYDIGGNYNTSTGKFTAPVAGVYLFSLKLTFEDTDNDFDHLTFGFKRIYGGSNIVYHTLQYDMNEMLEADGTLSQTDNEGHAFTYTAQLKLSLNDTVEVVYHMDDSTGDLRFDQYDYQKDEVTSNEGCYFEGHLITAI